MNTPTRAAEAALFTRQSRTALRGILILAIIATMYFARDFLVPVVLALFIALTFRPAIRYLSKRGVPPGLAATGFLLVLLTSGFAASYILSGPIAAWIDQAPEFARAFSEKFRGIRQSISVVADLSEKLQDVSEPANSSAVQEVMVRQPALPAILALVTGYPVRLAVLFLATLVIAVFLMASGELFYEKLIRILPSFTDKKRALRIVYDIEREVSAYLLIVTAINACIGLAIAITFHVLGMPSPYLWGLLAFFLNFIPYVGPIAGASLSTFIAIATFDSLGYALLPLLAYVGWSLIESEFVSPHVLGRRLQMNAVAILLSLAFWTWLWGIAGAIIAVPLLVSIRVFCDHIDGLAGVGEFLSERRIGENGTATEDTKN